MTPSNRLAREKLRLFEALAAYANMGDTPAEWKKFDLKYPDFFPQELIRPVMYDLAERWHKDVPADLQKSLPPLLWYRNRLRSVWARIDRYGYSLAALLGFTQQAQAIGEQHRGEIGTETLYLPAILKYWRNGASVDSFGLPAGSAVLNGITGEIKWTFGCILQQAIHELMQERWRAKICPTCGKFFVAMKTAQKSCSVRCSDNAKRERALSWWNEKGSERRSEARQAQQSRRRERKTL